MLGRRFWQPRDARTPRRTLLEVESSFRRFAGPTIHTQQLQTPLRIVHLTDLHVGRVTPMRVQTAAIALTNAQEPDLVVITGDFVCHSQEYLEELGALMRSLKAPVMAVLGNHDYWSGAGEVRRTLERAGVEVLMNTHTIITLKGQRLQVVGLDDAYTGHADRERAVRGLRRNLPTLGLSHIAEEADALWAKNVPLVLSGHTHAGQVTLAGLHELAMGKWIRSQVRPRTLRQPLRRWAFGRSLCRRWYRRVRHAAADRRAWPARSGGVRVGHPRRHVRRAPRRAAAIARTASDRRAEAPPSRQGAGEGCPPRAPQVAGRPLSFAIGRSL